MSIYLVQHGLSNSKEIDPDQKLTEPGIADVTRIAGVAKGYSVTVKKICHSGKERARMTAEIFGSILAPTQGIAQINGINPMDDVTAFARDLDHSSNIMYIGHLPFMEKLTSFLVSGHDDITVFRFQNGGIVCLDKDNDATLWHIRWTLMPKVG
ncbi:MAG TPA: phosphohistidine phosphatase SixA [Spirochaetota bacterium]|nr:phosphohistidine phosphatase SixA [Spirochaetota bacterium]